ncbi:MAG: DNA repair protein RecO [Candidatus Omnitrophica bacterium]|nr:DNA repair protein RecO [Candidatus Omnitrophota bacterium]
MPIHKTEALILTRRDFRETSLITDFYSRDFGRLSGLLKGIRTEPKKFASSMEPFSLNEIVFYRNRSSGLHLVSQCDLKDNFTALRSNLARFAMASVITEMVSAIMQPEDKNSEIFDLLLNVLSEMSVSPNPEKVLTIFKIKMLSLSGFKPHLDSCVTCQDKIMGNSKFSLSLGGLICQKCCHKDLSARAIFRGTIASILYIEKSDFKGTLNLGLNPQIKKEELILNAFIKFHLEKDLKSERVAERLVGV